MMEVMSDLEDVSDWDSASMWQSVSWANELWNEEDAYGATKWWDETEAKTDI